MRLQYGSGDGLVYEVKCPPCNENVADGTLAFSLRWPPAASRMLISPERLTAGVLFSSIGNLVYAGTSAASACLDIADGSLGNNVAPVQVKP